MIVLGMTNDETGTQLEILTANVLRSLGYGDVSANVVHAGGSEVDVVGNFLVPVPGGSGASVGVIGECKAHRRRVNLDEWHKLLGKLYVERMRSPQTIGIFIALNGFNGNVVGAHKDFERSQPNVMHLIDRDKTERIVLERYGAVSREEVETLIRRFTGSRIVLTNLAYYDDGVLWLIEFSDGRYAALDGKGEPAAAGLVPGLKERIDNFTGGAELIDLEAEQAALQAQASAARSQIARLFANGGTLDNAELSDDPEHPASEHRRASERLEAGGLIRLRDGLLALAFQEAENKAEVFLKTILFFVTGRIKASDFSRVFCSELFVQTVDDDLAAHACLIQGQIPVPADGLAEIAFWMRMSPGALVAALTPQQMIVQHRVEQGVRGAEIDEHDIEHFRSMLMTAFLEDLRREFLGGFYYEKGVYEAEEWTRIVIKGPGGNYDARNFRRDVALEGKFGGLLSLRSATDLVGPEWDWMLEVSD